MTVKQNIYDMYIYFTQTKGYDMKKVSDAELLEIQTLRDSLVEIITSVGELNLNKFLLQKQIDSVIEEIEKQQTRFVEFQEKERVLFGKLQETYGTGNINLETGEIAE